MFDFSKYNLQELQAMSAVLDDLTYRMNISELMQAHLLPYHYYKEVTGAVAAAIDQQARDHAAAEAEKVDRIKKACVAGAPPAEEPDELHDLRALVDTLSRCSDQLVALALAEDKNFAECSQTDVFNKVTMLRDCKQALNNMVSDIRDHYDGLH